MKFTEFLKDKLVKNINEEAPGGRGDEWGDDPVPAPKKGKKGKGEEGKPEKELKHFEVGDVIVLVDTKKSNKLPMDAYDFLMTYKKFTVIKVNDKGKLDLGCHISKNEPDGTGVEKIFTFFPNRFELEDKELAKSREMNKIKPVEIAEEGEAGWEGMGKTVDGPEEVDPDVD